MDNIKLARKKQNTDPMWKVLVKEVDLGDPTSFLGHVFWVVLNENAKRAKILWTIREICLNLKSPLELQKSYLILRKLGANISSWSNDMEGHAKKCVERYCERANKNNSTFFESRNSMP